MKYDVVGSYLPPMSLLEAREAKNTGRISQQEYKAVEDDAVRAVIDAQIKCSLPHVTTGEVRRNFWDWDFYFGLNGITRERLDDRNDNCDMEAFTDVMRFTGKIEANPTHPFLDDFRFMRDYVGGRTRVMQTLPSPAELYMRIVTAETEYFYPTPETLVDDIIRAYRDTIMMFYNEGCHMIQLDDTVCGRLCDRSFTKPLLQGGLDLMKIQDDVLRLLNGAIDGLPADLEVSLYLSSGPTVIPEWDSTPRADNIMPKVLSTVNARTFIMPFNVRHTSDLTILRYIPDGRNVMLGIINAHTPFPDNIPQIEEFVGAAVASFPNLNILVSPLTGFKVSSYARRGLLFEDQWNKITELETIAHEL